MDNYTVQIVDECIYNVSAHDEEHTKSMAIMLHSVDETRDTDPHHGFEISVHKNAKVRTLSFKFDEAQYEALQHVTPGSPTAQDAIGTIITAWEDAEADEAING